MRSKSSFMRHTVHLAATSLFLAAMAFVGVAGSPFRALADEPIKWSKEVERSLKEAKDQHKYVLADVYTDWCGWCKRLDQQTFSNDGMSSFLNGKFICIKVNAEDKGEGTKLANKYRVKGYPCALVFDQTGKFIGKISGFFPPDEYQQQITKLIENPPAAPEM